MSQSNNPQLVNEMGLISLSGLGAFLVIVSGQVQEICQSPKSLIQIKVRIGKKLNRYGNLVSVGINFSIN